MNETVIDAELRSSAGASVERTLAKHQPCGCVVCTCEDPERCHGCGAKNCGTHPAQELPNPRYASEPSVEPDEKPIELWNGDRKVTIYSDTVLRAWGVNIVSEMSDEPRNHNTVNAAVRWLYESSGEPSEKQNPATAGNERRLPVGAARVEGVGATGILICVGCAKPTGTVLDTPICSKLDEQGDGEGGTSHYCATCGHGSDCHEPVFAEYEIRQFCGYLTGYLTELHQTHPGSVWDGWCSYLKSSTPTKGDNHG